MANLMLVLQSQYRDLQKLKNPARSGRKSRRVPFSSGRDSRDADIVYNPFWNEPILMRPIEAKQSTANFVNTPSHSVTDYRPKRGLSVPSITVLDREGRIVESEQRQVF